MVLYENWGTSATWRRGPVFRETSARESREMVPDEWRIHASEVLTQRVHSTPTLVQRLIVHP